MTLSACVKPDAAAVAAYLELVYGDGVTASAIDAVPPKFAHGGRFVNDNQELVAVCVCDLAFAAFSGCALSMIPPTTAAEMVAAGELSDSARDNFHEVMSLCSRLIMSNTSPHLRLADAPAAEALREAVTALGPAEVASFSVRIPKYGRGQIAFLIS